MAIDTAGPVEMWRPPGLGGIVCMTGSTSSYEIEPYDEYVLAGVRAGAMRATRRRVGYDVGAGDVVRWDPSSRHAGRPLAGAAWTADVLLVELPTLRRWTLDEGDDAPAVAFGKPVLRDPHLAAAFGVLLDALDDPSADVLTVQSMLARTLRAAVWPGGDSGADHRRQGARGAVDEARDYLHANLTRQITLDELADAAGLGKFRLVREFTAQVGVPPHRYLLARRLSLARRRLEEGVDIASVAVELGFVDQSHLHRHFRRAFAMTPAAYRRRFAGRSRGTGGG